MEIVIWGINLFLGCLFGLEVYHHMISRYLPQHRRLQLIFLCVFLASSLKSLAYLLSQPWPEEVNQELQKPLGLSFASSPVVPIIFMCFLLLLYVGYNMTYRKLNGREASKV